MFELKWTDEGSNVEMNDVSCRLDGDEEGYVYKHVSGTWVGAIKGKTRLSSYQHHFGFSTIKKAKRWTEDEIRNKWDKIPIKSGGESMIDD